MSRLSSIDRAVLRCAGTPAAQVAAALGYTVEQVRASRDRLGRNHEDGLELGPAPTRPTIRLDLEDFDVLMRSNRSVCG